LLIVLMLIGAAPGSAAGGMKTTTIAVVLAALAASFRGDNCVIIHKREIELRTVLRAFTVMVLFILLTWAGTEILKSLTPELNTTSCFFEAASALSATGLSTGETTMMWNTACKLLLILFMFAGRLGPVTIILFFVGKEKKETLRYPEERIIVG
jgi:trk system potassium uptake protein TrkH